MKAIPLRAVFTLPLQKGQAAYPLVVEIHSLTRSAAHGTFEASPVGQWEQLTRHHISFRRSDGSQIVTVKGKQGIGGWRIDPAKLPAEVSA